MLFRLKELRVRKGKTQKDVAEYLMISPQSVSKWEKGESLPSIEYLPKLADFLDCGIDDFFEKPRKQQVDSGEEKKWSFSSLLLKTAVVRCFNNGKVSEITKKVIEGGDDLVHFLKTISKYLLTVEILPIKILYENFNLDYDLAAVVQESLCLMGIMAKDDNGYPMKVNSEKAKEFKMFLDANFCGE